MARTHERSFWVQLISKHALRQYMAYRGYSLGQLAKEVGCPKATIAHLHTLNGGRNTIGPDFAKKIEKALDAPAGSLFVPRVSVGATAAHQRRTTAAQHHTHALADRRRTTRRRSI